MVQIKFIKFGANSAFGNFGPGDKLRTSEAMARHLVDSGVAVYDEAKKEAVEAPPAERAAEPAPEQPRKRKGK